MLAKQQTGVFRLISNKLRFIRIVSRLSVSEVSTHISRFIFATTVCLTQGVPIETLSQMMGHLSIKTTQIYAEVTRTKINEDMTNLAKTIQGKYELPETDNKIYKSGRRNRRFTERESENNL